MDFDIPSGQPTLLVSGISEDEMTFYQAISAFKNASIQLSFVNLTDEERQRLIRLAEETKEILDRAAKRPATH